MIYTSSAQEVLHFRRGELATAIRRDLFWDPFVLKEETQSRYEAPGPTVGGSGLRPGHICPSGELIRNYQVMLPLQLEVVGHNLLKGS